MRKKERFVLGKRTFRSQKSKHFVLRIIHLNPVDQARQLAAEVVKRLGQLNLHRRELERKLHVANGFFTSLEEKK